MNIDDFRSLFDQYYQGLKSFIYYKIGDIEAAEDIVQEVFLKLWDKRESIEMKTVKSFLFTIANNMSINHLKHRTIVFNFARNEIPRNSAETPQFALELKEFQAKLEKILADMPENSRVVFLMNRIEKLTYNEIAERLGLSVKAIEKRMSSALSFLRDKLEHPI
jgi:RNA polymerase sigma-70 factor (ECF subfamily)